MEEERVWGLPSPTTPSSWESRAHQGNLLWGEGTPSKTQTPILCFFWPQILLRGVLRDVCDQQSP